MTSLKLALSFIVSLLLVSATLGQQSTCLNGQCPQQRLLSRATLPTRVVQQPIFVLPTYRQDFQHAIVSQPRRQTIVAQPILSSTVIHTIQTRTEKPIVQVPFVSQAKQDVPIILNPLAEEVSIDASQLEAFALTNHEDRFDQITRATVRVTVSGVCGSGTIVGRDSNGTAIVLTNAHVAGTTRGRSVSLERWNIDGSSEKGTGTIIAAGYGRGMSIDFALLKCNEEFATDVTPIPLADRYPDTEKAITTFGCPRCEWPSLQVLKLNRSEGQVLTWAPEAIGGRSGSSIIEHTTEGPRVVGLLTWGGGGEGLGQSTPFLLSAMRGKLPKSIETLPEGVREVCGVMIQPMDVPNSTDNVWDKFVIPAKASSDSAHGICPYPRTVNEHNELGFFQVPATTGGKELLLPVTTQPITLQSDDEIVDSITEEGIRDRLRPNRVDPEVEDDCTENGIFNRERTGPVRRGVNLLGQWVLVIAVGAACLFVGFLYGKHSISFRE